MTTRLKSLMMFVMEARMSNRIVPGLVAFVLAAVLTACGTGGQSVEPTPTATSRPRPTATPIRPPNTLEELCAMIGNVALELPSRVTECETFEKTRSGTSTDGTWLNVKFQMKRQNIETAAPLAVAEVADILRVVYFSDYQDFKRIQIAGTYPVTDVFGNTKEGQMFSADWSTFDVNKINWDGFDHRRVFEIAAREEFADSFVDAVRSPLP